MDAATIIATISGVIKTAVDLTPDVIQVAEDAAPFAQAIYGLFQGTNVTQAQLDQLTADIATLSAELQQPLPPDDGTFQ